MRTIMKSERQVEGGFKKYLLKYELIANGFRKMKEREHIME